MIDFDVPRDIREFLDRLDGFISESVAPLERQYGEAQLLDDTFETEALPQLRDAARAAGVYGPQLPTSRGGHDLGTTALGLVSEGCGAVATRVAGSEHHGARRSDDAPAAALRVRHAEGSVAAPFAAGRIRSCFGMTETDAGADPRHIRSTA